ncbi:hypothetical protein BC834DRAFT_129879 [Gloeopeniophorella convolvens]|nr:hypothetical protein BC834DRAFT_129879 [Gloeopeniophorella convolvens]
MSTVASSTVNGTAPAPTATQASGGSHTASASMLFAFLVVIMSLFACFMLAGYFWHYGRRRRGIVLQFDEAKGTYTGVPKMWEVWIQADPNGSKGRWESMKPLSVDAGPASTKSSPVTPPARRPWFHHASRRSPMPSQPRLNGAGAGVPGSVDGIQVSFIVAMPGASAQSWRRSGLSQHSSHWGQWQTGEYVIGTYHAPFREGGVF